MIALESHPLLGGAKLVRSQI